MTAPTIQTDQATWDHAVTTGMLLVTMPGEECVHGLITGRACGEDRIPPRLLVDAAKPCGCRCHRDAMYRQLHDDSQCDCHNGKRRITVQVSCPGPPHHGFYGPGKDACSGTITVGTVALKWGPLLVVDSHAPPETCPKGDYVELTVSQGYLSLVVYTPVSTEFGPGGVWDWKPGPTLSPGVDPAPLVGQYAAAFEVLP